MSLRSLLLLCLVAAGSANVYDVLMSHYLPPAGCRCADWTSLGDPAEQKRIDATWLDGKPPAAAGAACAMPGASAGLFECDGCTVDKIYNSFAGPWCYCNQTKEQYCVPPVGVPEQINIQLAAPTVAVASFVTHDSRPATPDQRPVAMFGKSPDSLQPISGLSHPYAPLSAAERTNYSFHFIRFGELEPKQVL